MSGKPLVEVEKIVLFAPEHASEGLPDNVSFVWRRSMGHDDFIEIVGFRFSGRKNLVVAIAENLASRHTRQSWAGLAETYTDDKLIVRRDSEQIVSGHFRAGLAGIHGDLLAVDDIFMKSVFDVGSCVRLIKDSSIIGLVFGEQKRYFLFEIDPTQTKFGMVDHYCAYATWTIDGFE